MVITPPKVIREKIDLITKTLKNIQRMTFSGLIADKASRVEVVVTFLALLELVKRYRVTARQDTLFGDIPIRTQRGLERRGRNRDRVRVNRRSMGFI